MKHLLLIALLFTLPACASAPPKVVIDRADRAAYLAVRGFQTLEEVAWHSRLAWPTPKQHADINAKVSQAYQLIVDVANLGISLPPGSKLTMEDLAAVTKLTAVVADIVALTQCASADVIRDGATSELAPCVSASAAVRQAATSAQSKVETLAASVKGGL